MATVTSHAVGARLQAASRSKEATNERPCASDQTAGGKVLWHSTMSLDGFVAGPNHAMESAARKAGLGAERISTRTSHSRRATYH
jgi:hypothetical protein